MESNKNYVKFVDGTRQYAPRVLDWSQEHTETYPKLVIDEETGEEKDTGETETYTWTEKHRYAFPTRQQYADMGWYLLVDKTPTESAGDGKHWEAAGVATAESSYELVEPDDRPKYYRRTYSAVDDPVVEETPVVRKWTRLTLINALDEAGLWDDVETMLGHKGLIKLLGCDYILEDNETFVAAITAAKAQFGEETVTKFLDSLPTEA